MADDYNPFSLLMTPENLGRVRSAEFEERTAGQSFWAREAGRTGLRLRSELLNQGIAMSPSDTKALSTQAIVAGAQKRLSDLVKSGEMDPLEAQATVLTESMSAFMQSGDYESAQSLLPSLNKIRTYQLEQDKLMSEVGENVAQAGQARAAGRLSDTRGQVALERLPSQIALDLARAGQANRSPVVRPTKDGSGGGEHLKSTVDKVQQQILAGATALNRITQIAEVTLSNPGVGTNTAASIAAIADETKGLAALSRSSSDGHVKFMNKKVEDGSEAALGRGYTEFRRKAINVAYGEYKSLTMDLAYSLARARDPGGRLSDADIENAMRIIGAAGDPARMVSVLNRLGENSYNDLMRMKSTYRGPEFDAPYSELDTEYNNFRGLLEAYSGKQKPAAAPAANIGPPPAGVTAEEWAAMSPEDRKLWNK